MSDSPPPPTPADFPVPPPPPPLNRKLLWHSLLWPPGLIAAATILWAAVADTSGYAALDSFFLLCVSTCVPVVAGWGLFIYTIAKRYQGWSLALLIIGYPLIQGIILIAILFLGCVAFSYRAGA